MASKRPIPYVPYKQDDYDGERMPWPKEYDGERMPWPKEYFGPQVRSQSILIRDDVQLAEQRRAVREEATRRARRFGKWFCPGKCGRIISANAEKCLACANKKEENDELV
jgi:hypothetical protein